MKCVIVAAGQGTRLRAIAPLKPLAPLLGVPLIVRVIETAMAGGVSEFVVVTGYEGAWLEQYLEALTVERGLNLTCVRNPDWMGSNGLSVAAAAPYVDGKFILLMSDHLFDPDIVTDLAKAHWHAPEVVLAVDSRLDNPLVDLNDVTRVDVSRSGVIRRIGKHIEPYNAFDTGVFLASPLLIGAIRDSVAAGGGGGISEGMQALADRGLARTFDIGGRFWLDVDDPAAFVRAEYETGQRMSN